MRLTGITPFHYRPYVHACNITKRCYCICYTSTCHILFSRILFQKQSCVIKMMRSQTALALCLFTVWANLAVLDALTSKKVTYPQIMIKPGKICSLHINVLWFVWTSDGHVSTSNTATYFINWRAYCLTVIYCVTLIPFCCTQI